MVISFLDDCKIDDWLGQCGLIVGQDKLLAMENEFVDILRASGVPVDAPGLDTEVKWSPSKGNWIRENLGEKRSALYEKLLSLIKKHDMKLVGAVLGYGIIKDWTEEKAREQAFIHTFERIQTCAEILNTPVMIICDSETDPKATKTRIKETFQLVRTGTDYMPLKHIYGHAWFAESQRHAGIQLADLITGITTSMVAGKQKFAAPLWSKLQGSFARHKSLNIPQKWGLSILPTPQREEFVGQYNPYG